MSRVEQDVILSVSRLGTSMVKKSSETGKLEISTAGSTVDAVPSQGLLLCPKIEPIKKKKKKKIAPTITANTSVPFTCASIWLSLVSFREALDVDDSIVDSILFDEMQSVQQQWQQLMMLSMEKELHIQPSEGKKKVKLKKFTRTNEFFLAYESLFDFDGMRHWCPTTRWNRLFLFVFLYNSLCLFFVHLSDTLFVFFGISAEREREKLVHS